MKLDFIKYMNNYNIKSGLKNKIMIYKLTVYYNFVHYGYFMKRSNDIILEFWDIIY